MRIHMLTAYPGIAGPLPKLAPLVIGELRRLGCTVSTDPWSHREEHEGFVQKVAGRTRDLLRVRRHLRRDRCDVLLVTTTHDWPALLRDMPLLLVTRGLCGARVLHLHGSMVDRLVRPGHGLMRWCSRWLVHQCDAVLVLSEEERREWRSFSPETRFEVVANPFVPLPGTPAGPRKGGVPVLLFIGRLIPEKGVFDLLEALRIVRTELPCTLRIAGKGPAGEELRLRIAALGLEECVELAGYVEGDDLLGLYASSSVFVLPTYFGEGFPTVITEAMSCGLPIITTPLRGAADLLTEGENTLFVPPRRPDELAAAIMKILNDPPLAADIGRRNREKVREFAPEAVVPRYLEIMESLVH
jgi:glycosyltransferase involved in cell wall biosynthesis